MRFLRPVLMVLGVVFLLLANVLLWLNVTVFDSSSFASAVDKTMDDPQVQQRAATVISQQAADQIDLKPVLVSALPDNLQFVTRFVNGEVEETVLYRVILRLLNSEFTGDLRTEVIERLHMRVLNVLEGNGAVKSENNQLILDLRPVVDRAFDRIGVDVPKQVQSATDEGAGVIVIADNTKYLQAASFFVSNRNVFLIVMLIGAVACFAGFVLTATERLHELSNVGFAVAVTGLLTLLIGFIANQFIPSERIVLQDLVHNLEGELKRQSIGLLIIGAAIVASSDLGVRSTVGTAWQHVAVYGRRLGSGQLLIGALVVGLALVLLT